MSNLPQEIYWFGHKGKSVGNNVEGILSRVKSVRLVKKNNKEMVEIVPSGGGPARYADYIIVAGGYKDSLNSVLGELSNKTSIFSLMRPIEQNVSPNGQSAVAKQLYLSDKPQKIFFIGAAKGENEKTAILTDSPKTEAFAKLLKKRLLPDQN